MSGQDVNVQPRPVAASMGLMMAVAPALETYRTRLQAATAAAGASGQRPTTGVLRIEKEPVT